MKVLPMQQPWASLVMRGVKTTETRDRHTNHRGPIAVLATQTHVHYDAAPAAWDALAVSLDVALVDLLADCERGTAQRLQPPRGKVIGVVSIVDSVRAADVGWDASADLAEKGWLRNPPFVRLHPDQRPFGGFGPGRRVWLLDEPHELTQPIICRGMPGIFDAPPDVAAEIALQLAQVTSRG